MDFQTSLVHLLEMQKDATTDEAVAIVEARIAQIEETLKHPDIDDPKWILDQIKKLLEL